jgi:hypothetical protein
MAGNQCREIRCRIGLEPLCVGLFILVIGHQKVKPRPGGQRGFEDSLGRA